MNPRARIVNTASVPLLDTHPPSTGEAIRPRGFGVKMKVQSIEPESNPNLVLARFWNGQSLGGADIPVETEWMMEVGTVFYAFQPEGGTLELYETRPVSWRAMPNIPKAQYQYDLLGAPAQLQVGYIGPRAVPDRNEIET